MERQSLYERFKLLSWQEQLGNLAATLAKISSQALEPSLDQLTCLFLREAALMIEWSAKNVPTEFHQELAAIQKECLEWQKQFPIENARVLLSLTTRNQSERVLQFSGISSESLLVSY
jgi:hypothetical protein